MTKQLITLLAAVLVCCSCYREDFSVDPTLMPPVTQAGANTFGCLIDGWVYTGHRYNPGNKATYYPAFGEEGKAIVRIRVQVDAFAYISFDIIDPKETSINIYSTSGGRNHDQVIYTNAVFNDANTQEMKLEDGIVRITRFDINENIISGTFEGGRMQEGRFDLRF